MAIKVGDKVTIEIKKSDSTETKGGNTSVGAKEDLHFQEKVEVRFISRPEEKLDGGTIIDVFKKLQNNGSKNSLYDQNPKNAFKNFRAAMEDSDLICRSRKKY
jgi:hypothetical protein